MFYFAVEIEEHFGSRWRHIHLRRRYPNGFHVSFVSTVPLFKTRSLSKQTEVFQLLKHSEYDKETVVLKETADLSRPGRVLPYMGYIGMGGPKG